MDSPKCSYYASKLHRLTAADSNRYYKTVKVRPAHRRISPGLFATQEPEPRYLPEGWSTFIQAEGQLYFYNQKYHTVTNAYIHDGAILKKVTLWMHVVLQLAVDRDVKLPPTAELFLQLDEQEDFGCGYYFVDHRARTEFWLDEFSTEDIDIPESSSLEQLRYALEEHYWMHVEYFPMHLSGLRVGIARELMSVLSHGRADQLTSANSTCPFSASQCTEFLEMLRSDIPVTLALTETITDGNVICIIARIWSQIARHRYLHFYGEETARLSRDQRMLSEGTQSSPFYIRAAYRMLLGVPRSYARELDGLWVDELVYKDAWKPFMQTCLDEWKEAVMWMGILTLSHGLFFIAGIGAHAVAVSSLAVSVSGLAAGVILSHYHRMPVNLEASEIGAFLSRAQHPTLNFHPLAIAYALPRALLFYSTFLLLAQIALTVVLSTDQVLATSLLGTLSLVLCVLGAVLRRGCVDQFQVNADAQAPWWRRLFFRGRSQESKEADVECEAA